MDYKIRLAREEDYPKIKKLQEENHFNSVNNREKKEEGFVSVETDIFLLREINELLGIIVVIKNEEIVAYEIPLDLDISRKISLLNPFINLILDLEYKSKKLSHYNFIIEGQICVKKGLKGQGIANELHKNFIERFKEKYDFIVTEVSDKNPRSLPVHKHKLGFSILKEYSAEGRHWYVLIQEI